MVEAAPCTKASASLRARKFFQTFHIQVSCVELPAMTCFDWLISISLRTLGIGFALLIVYLVCLTVYRLYLSPLAIFPGPKLAALTLWYEFYYDVVKRGKYTWKIGEMHKKYGRC
jgi:hypothetical protein